MENELIGILKRTGGLITDSHLVGTSGRHMSAYINKDALLMHPAESSRVGELFAEKNRELQIDVVVGPAMGAILLAQWTAYHLGKSTGREILAVYTDKTADNGQVLKRGYDKAVAGKNVLIVEDTTTTGGSVIKVLDTVRSAGGNVTQVSVMLNRDPKSITAESIGAPFSWLAELAIDSWEEAKCPLCAAGVPVNTAVGHGKKFLESKAHAG